MFKKTQIWRFTERMAESIYIQKDQKSGFISRKETKDIIKADR